MKRAALKGKFLVLDGPDGSGKSTQVKLLAEVIANGGAEVELVCDPGGTEIGSQIRRILLDRGNVAMSVYCEMLLYMASRAQLYSERIAPALAAGKCVISDRWVSSTYAYQAVAGEIGNDAVLAVANACLERTWPDLTMIIDLADNVAMDRVGHSRDRMEEKGQRFHSKVREAFLALAKSGKAGAMVVVDGNGSIERVHHRLLEAIECYVDS